MMAQRKDWDWPQQRAVPSQVERRWYVATARPGKGRDAVYELHARDYDAYQPTETVWYRPGNGRSKIKRWQPLFGRYLFVGVAEGQGFHQIHAVEAVQGLLVDEKGAPAPIDFSHIDKLRQAETLGAFDKTNSSTLDIKIGGMVTIQSGEFEGLVAEVRKAKGEKRWLVFLKELRFPLNVEESELEPIEP